MSELELEQRTLNFLLLVDVDISASFWDNAMKKTAVYKWVKNFSEGRESVTDEERSGQPATSRTEENVAKFVKLCVKIIS